LAWGSCAAAEKPIVLKLAHSYLPGTVWYDIAARFGQAVERRAGGSVEIQIAAQGLAGDWPAAVEGLGTGRIDIVLQGFGILEHYAPVAGISGYPFLIRDADHFKRVFYGPVGRALFAEITKESGRHIIGAGYRGARYLTSNKPIAGVADLKGMRIRVPPLKMYRRTWETLGAVAVPTGLMDIPLALRRGMVEGQENPLEEIRDLDLASVQKYLIATEHVVGAMTFILDEKRFRALPPEVQTWLTEEGERAMQEATARVVVSEWQIRDDLTRQGMQLIEVDRKAFQDRLAPMAEEFPVLAPWVKEIQAVR
jgi:TRAP-type C4-dicarboxylate transport system substrate-binding protein